LRERSSRFCRFATTDAWRCANDVSRLAHRWQIVRNSEPSLFCEDRRGFLPRQAGGVRIQGQEADQRLEHPCDLGPRGSPPRYLG
jgi:hypothetical protein